MYDIMIRKAMLADADALYALGAATPELQVSATEPFMEPEEFRSALANPTGIMLLAELEGAQVGFIYAAWSDIERAPKSVWACLVYLVVRPDRRRHGIARRLHEACVEELKRRGVKKLYGWANDESDGSVIAFMKRQGFTEGHRYVWMDKTL